MRSSEVTERITRFVDLYPVHFKGTYVKPHDKYLIIVLVAYCEYEESSMFATEVMFGKGSMSHKQYALDKIPGRWIPIQLPKGVDDDE